MPSALTPVTNLGSAHERALRAYLRDAFADEAAPITWAVSNDFQDRAAPLIEFISAGGPEDPPHTRRETHRVTIRYKWPGAQEPSARAGTHFADINRVTGLIMAAMSQTDDSGRSYAATARLITAAGRLLATTGTALEQSQNADMANYTCDYVQYLESVRAQTDGVNFYLTEARVFELRGAPYNVD